MLTHQKELMDIIIIIKAITEKHSDLKIIKIFKIINLKEQKLILLLAYLI